MSGTSEGVDDICDSNERDCVRGRGESERRPELDQGGVILAKKDYYFGELI